jgi:hypothetical protein
MFCIFRMNGNLVLLLHFSRLKRNLLRRGISCFNELFMVIYSNSDSATSFEGRKCSSVVFFHFVYINIKFFG